MHAFDHPTLRRQSRLGICAPGSGWIGLHRVLPWHAHSKPGRPPVPDGQDEIKGPWTLTFPADNGSPKPLQINPPFSWSVQPDPNVRNFSGTANYTNDFQVPDLKSRITLDLGQVEIIARVKASDTDLGILWKAPYQVDITSAVVRGANHLEISLVNLWVNHLIGDQALPEDSERDKTGNLVRWPQWAINGKSSPTGRKSFVTFTLWKTNEALRKSGLLGPVMLRLAANPPATAS